MKIRRQSWALWLMLAAVLGMLLSACNALKPMTAMEIMQKAVENTNQLQTVRYKMTVDASAAGQAMQLKGEGMVQLPNKAYAKMEMLGQTVETLQLSKDEIYARQAGTSEWQAVTADQLSQSGLNTDVISQQNTYFEFYRDAALAEKTQINGVDCYHITFNLDLDGLMKKMMQAEVLAMIDTSNGSGKGEAWVSQKDLLIQRVTIEMNYAIQGQAVSSKTTMDYSDFNEPVELPTP